MDVQQFGSLLQGEGVHVMDPPEIRPMSPKPCSRFGTLAHYPRQHCASIPLMHLAHHTERLSPLSTEVGHHGVIGNLPGALSRSKPALLRAQKVESRVSTCEVLSGVG